MVPHRVGDDDIIGADLAVRRLEFWIDHRIAARHLDGHVVDDRVHLGDGVALGCQFLPVELERHLGRGIKFATDELQLHQQTR